MNITTHCSSVPTQADPFFSYFPRSFTPSGLTVHVSREQQQCSALVDLQQVAERLDHDEATVLQLLSAKELEYFKRFSFPKRRHEWLGGRIAAKTALAMRAKSTPAPVCLRQISILPDELGRPKPGGATGQSLSISHSSGFAVALASGHACGIDLQKISPRLPGLIDRFTGKEEISLLSALNNLKQTTLLTMIWTAKEAVKKSMLSDQPGIFAGIRILEASGISSNIYHLRCSIRSGLQQDVRIHDFSPYILALTGAVDHA